MFLGLGGRIKGGGAAVIFPVALLLLLGGVEGSSVDGLAREEAEIRSKGLGVAGSH